MTETQTTATDATHSHANRLAALTLGAIGVVYGDIGTSPLYAFRESIHHVSADGITDTEVMGILSLLIWSLIIVVTFKYILFMLRADNNGEGGILSLLALVRHVLGKRTGLVMLFGMTGGALFYGDAMLTPAISVLSAIEGMKLITPAIDDWVVPLAIVILLGLFLIQRHGTGKVSIFFGPITLLWFTAMAACAIPHILLYPHILQCFFPNFAVQFLLEHQTMSLAVLGGVFLAVTGAEALYADMGHFGRKPIRLAWLFVVFPALTINYIGQGALVLHTPEALENPFFLLAPEWALFPMVILATLATIVASQAVITGAFSLTRQAIQLGLLPRFAIKHTSETESGQIFLPRINTILAFGVIYLVIEFKSSSELAAAYGIAVCGTMIIGTILAGLMLRYVWRKSMLVTALVIIPFIALEGSFMLANLIKIADGGYVPLLIGGFIVILMACWQRGTHLINSKETRMSIPLEDFISSIVRRPPPRVPGTAIFLTQNANVTPAALLHNIKHNKILHQQNIILTIVTETSPRVEPLDRIEIGDINEEFIVVRVHFGYMETPNVSKALQLCRKSGVNFDIMHTSFFVSRRLIRTQAKTLLKYWADRIYILMARGATRPTDYFSIPTDRVIELGAQTTL